MDCSSKEEKSDSLDGLNLFIYYIHKHIIKRRRKSVTGGGSKPFVKGEVYAQQ